MAIKLGKDATLTVGGAIASVRNIQFSAAARTIEIDAYGSRLAEAYSTGWEASVSFEALNSADIDLNKLLDGTVVTVSGGNLSWSFDAIVTSISEADPLDGVAAYQVECRLTRTGLR